jgi:AraC family transcriptional regulator
MMPTPYSIAAIAPRVHNTPVTISDLPAMRLATVPHTGPYREIGPAFQKLGAIAGAGGLFEHPGAMMVGIYRDDPQTTPASSLRSAAALVVPDGVALSDGLIEERLPAGRYATLDHVGPYEGLPDAWQRLAHHEFPSTGRARRDGPSLELYKNDPTDTPPDQLVTTICVPVA